MSGQRSGIVRQLLRHAGPDPTTHDSLLIPRLANSFILGNKVPMKIGAAGVWKRRRRAQVRSPRARWNAREMGGEPE